MGTTKPFSRDLFERNDALARAVITAYLQSLGYKVESNPNRFGVDLYATAAGGKRHAVECEIKRVWKGPHLHWKTLQLPQRKAKYRTQQEPGTDVNYWILNEDCTAALVIRGELLDKHRPVMVPNKYVVTNEYFYQIPVEDCEYVEMRGLGEIGK